MDTRFRFTNRIALTMVVFLFCTVWIAGCAAPPPLGEDRPERIPELETSANETATPAPLPSITVTPVPTETPTPLPTETPAPTSTPSPEPTHTPSPTPTSEPMNVFGDLSLSFNPYDDTVDIPESPGNLTLQVKSTETDAAYQIVIPEGQTAFSASLPPGQYVMQTLYIGAFDVTPSVVAGTFNVPETGCVHIGNIALSYHRLPPGNLFEQLGLAQKISQGQDILLTYMESGSIFLDTAKLSNPTPETLQEDARACTLQAVVLP